MGWRKQSQSFPALESRAHQLNDSSRSRPTLTERRITVSNGDDVSAQFSAIASKTIKEEVTLMKEFERSETVNASSDRVFDFLSDINNLPQYLPTVRNARQESADRIRVQGEAAGRQYDSTGYFRADRQNQRMEWGSDSESGYRGWLQVSEVDDDSCEVTVHLAFDPQNKALWEMDERAGDHERVVNEGIENALQSIKRICEGRGGKVEAARQK
jgi:ribosome-associated toxin RatA of RatAB toxin-antitoxin module